MAWLLLDAGNTTVKAGLAVAGQLAEGALRLAPEAASLDELKPWLEQIEGAVLLPGATTTAQTVGAWWASVFAGRRLRIVGDDLPLPVVGQYPGMGLDRVVAGLAAALDQPALVVDAGTATTFSAWHAGPHFAGGLILPGQRAMAAGLVELAPALPLVEAPVVPPPAAAFHTPGAIAAALAIGWPAAVAACQERLRHATGIDRVILTGGDADRLRGFSAERRPFLVLEGLARLAEW